MNIALLTVEEIKSELRKLGVSDEEISTIKGRNKLGMKLAEELETREDEETVNISADFASADEFEHPSPTVLVEKPEVETITTPTIGSDGWEDYVLSLLSDSEIEVKDNKKYPKVSGLRRLVPLLLGDILKSGPTMVFPPASDDSVGRATVVYEVSIAFRDQRFRNSKLVLNHLADSDRHDIRTFSEAADAWYGNTPDKFAIHPVATASSRAEGRALKRALQLSQLVAEEMSNDKDVSLVVEKTKNQVIKTATAEWQETAPIAANQLAVLNKKCEDLGIDVGKFVTSNFPEVLFVDNLTKSQASTLLVLLNKYQTKTSTSLEVPVEILKDNE